MEAIATRPESIRIIRRIEPFVSIRIENTRYLLKTADTYPELKEVMRLRSRVFSAEYGAPTGAPGFDVDDFDFQCDHLLIIEKSTGEVVGTYRMLCSRFVSEFYSQTEFNLDRFLASPGTKLELGRACIAPEHRKGATLSLLWRGIVRYARETRSDYLFGCSSVKTTDAAEAKRLHLQLAAAGACDDTWGIFPIGRYRIEDFESITPGPETAAVPIPPLLQSYLNAGAKIHGAPARDIDFNCIDLITILRLSDLSQTHEKFHTI